MCFHLKDYLSTLRLYFTVARHSHSWSMWLSGETQLPLLLCYIPLFFLFFFFLPPPYFPFLLHCCAVLINVHTPPHSHYFCTHIHSCCCYFLASPLSALPFYLMGLSINSHLYLHHFLLLFCLCVHFPVILYSIPSASLPPLVILWGSLSPSYPHPSSP